MAQVFDLAGFTKIVGARSFAFFCEEPALSGAEGARHPQWERCTLKIVIKVGYPPIPLPAPFLIEAVVANQTVS